MTQTNVRRVSKVKKVLLDRKLWRAVIRLAVLFVLVVISITTIITSLQLTILTSDYLEAESLRTNSQGIAAADSIQTEINQVRQQIYDSSNPVVSFIANLPDGWQELWAIVFIFSPVAYIYFISNYKIMKRKK